MNGYQFVLYAPSLLFVSSKNRKYLLVGALPMEMDSGAGSSWGLEGAFVSFCYLTISDRLAPCPDWKCTGLRARRPAASGLAQRGRFSCLVPSSLPSIYGGGVTVE